MPLASKVTISSWKNYTGFLRAHQIFKTCSWTLGILSYMKVISSRPGRIRLCKPWVKCFKNNKDYHMGCTGLFILQTNLPKRKKKYLHCP